MNEIPSGVELLAAVKGREAAEIIRAIDAGICLIGDNYIQDAERLYKLIGGRVSWHFIGHLQKNKTKKAVRLFDLVETIDSFDLAREIDRQCRLIDKPMPVMIEINSGREPQKHGVLPENTESLVRSITGLSYIRVSGLMTMGPAKEDPAALSPCFREVRHIFEYLKSAALPNCEMKYLSMGMSSSYKVAIEQGANLIRIGRKIFEQ